MLIILSPAKKINFDKQTVTKKSSQISLSAYSKELIGLLRDYSPAELSELMNISIKLSELNFERYLRWNLPFNSNDTKQAILAFNGHAYSGLKADNFNENDFEFSQKHLRILSGLYGVLKPLDLILPYRLEMGTKLESPSGKNLYHFWANTITDEINKAILNSGSNILINLASDEYYKAIKINTLNTEVIKPVFKENKNGNYKVISVYAKKARGLMTRFIIKNKLTNSEDIKAFNSEGYNFNSSLSNKNTFVFTRH